MDGATELAAEDVVDEPVLLRSRLRPANARRRTVARKWSPPRSVLDLGRAPGIAASMRCFDLVCGGHLQAQGSGSLYFVKHGHRSHLQSHGSRSPTRAPRRSSEFLAAQDADTSHGRPARRRARRRLLGLPVPARVRRAARRRRRLRVHGLRILVDAQSLPYVDGSSIDYVDSPAGRRLPGNNPNVVAACGCGSSFRVADEEQVSRGLRVSALAPALRSPPRSSSPSCVPLRRRTSAKTRAPRGRRRRRRRPRRRPLAARDGHRPRRNPHSSRPARCPRAFAPCARPPAGAEPPTSGSSSTGGAPAARGAGPPTGAQPADGCLRGIPPCAAFSGIRATCGGARVSAAAGRRS